MSKCDCGRWETIESAPRDGTSILLFHSSRVCGLDAWDSVREPPWKEQGWTHWAPLPPAPDGGGYRR